MYHLEDTFPYVLLGHRGKYSAWDTLRVRVQLASKGPSLSMYNLDSYSLERPHVIQYFPRSGCCRQTELPMTTDGRCGSHNKRIVCDKATV